jgi:superoxide dismutase, Fe-Mn family
MKLDRREFLRLAGVSAAALSLGSFPEAGVAAMKRGDQKMVLRTFELPPLPYAYNALEPFLDEKTLHLHHDKHHQAYVTGLNTTYQKLDAALEAGDTATAETLSRDLAFHGSGHILHSLLWTNMKPGGGGAPTGDLAEAINRDFGSYDKFKAYFLAAANQVKGSGWGILAYRPLDQALVVLEAQTHENLTQWGVIPLLVLDVWEHAYYLQYQNKRPEWTKTFMEHLVNWDDVAHHLQKIKGG